MGAFLLFVELYLISFVDNSEQVKLSLMKMTQAI
jgi:hypothetical protein